ncbi:MAG: NAD(+)/NADH kinase [Chloroflexia bacterium]|nr:NAD(+)/NADH kinase [Chloroflexia bacterium]
MVVGDRQSVPATRRPLESGEVRPPVRRVGLVAARSKAEARELGREVAAWLTAEGLVVVPEAGLEGAGSAVDAVVVLGGDGLMMRAANAYPDIPLLGINFGNVGFLALVERRDWRVALGNLIAGRYMVEPGATLAACLVRAGVAQDAGWAINDVVLRGGARMIDIEVYIDGHYVNTYPGDGMIVSTPHGSTAYCLAAGGPILTAGVRGFAIVPISCHSPIRTPLVVSEEDPIELLLANDRDASLILDGRETTPLRSGDVVRVTRGEHLFKLVTFGTTNFYEAFRTKFNFQIRPNAVPSLPARPDGRYSGESGEAERG